MTTVDSPGIAASGSMTAWRIVALVSLVLLVGFYTPYLYRYFAGVDGLFDSTGNPVGRDYVNMWTSASMVLAGEIVSIFDVTQFHDAQERLLGREFPLHNWSYPPHLIPFILALGFLPYLWGLAAWSGGTFAAYAVAAIAGRQRKLPLLAVLMLAPSTFINLASGQNGFLTSALMIGALRLLDRRPAWAGVLFGLLTIKPQLGILVPVALIAAGAWRAILSAVATTAILFAVTVALFGLDPWTAYARETAPFQTQIMEQGEGFFTLMMPTPFMAMRLLGWGISAGYWINAGTALVGAAVVAWSFRKKSLPSDLRAAILLTATMLATPYAFSYDMPAFSAALTCLLAFNSTERLRHGELFVIVAAWILPLGVMMVNGKGWPVGPVVLAALLIYLMLRAMAFVRRSEGGAETTQWAAPAMAGAGVAGNRGA